MSVLSRYARIWRGDSWVRPFFATYRKALVLSILLGILTVMFASALMFTSGYLISASAEEPATGVFALFVPLAFVQVFGLGKPFFGYFERLKSHDWVLHMTSLLRLKLYRSIETEATSWKATHRIGDALGLLSDDIDHVQDLYLRTIFPAVIACALWAIVVLVFGVCSPLFACGMALVVGVYVVVLPAVSVTVNGARRMRMKAAQSELYADVFDNIAGIEDWVCSGRRDDYAARIARTRTRLDAEKRRLASFARGRDLAAQLLFGVAAIAVLAWAAWHFGTVAQSGAGAGDIARPVNWVAAFVLGLFPLLEAFLPLSDAAVQAGVHMDSVKRLNEMPDAGAGAGAGTSESPTGERGEGSPLAGLAPCGSDIMLDDVFFSYGPYPAEGGDAESVESVEIESAEGAEGIESASRPSACPVDAEHAPATAPVSAGTPASATAPVRARTCVSDSAPAPVPAAAPAPDSAHTPVSTAAPALAPCETPVLQGVSLNIEAGRKIALLGPSGAGKSTIASLIRGDLAPSAGTLTIGGVPACELAAQMPRLVGVVEQETYLFNRSLLENIRLGDDSITEEQVAQALHDVGLDGLVGRLPRGLKTMVDEAGAGFSGGERHRVALARVLVRRTPIVVLDEPAAALDPCTEHELLQTMFRVFADRTLILITHHLLDMERMDRIVFLDGGRISMQGSPVELERSSERYRKLLAFDRGTA